MPKKISSISNYRVSSDEQLKSNSLARQEALCITAAKELDAPIIKSWSGSVSSKKGSNVDRRDLQEMLDFCKKNANVKYAIFDELDRFMRSMLEIGYFLIEFKKLGVKVVFASQPDLKTDTAANTLMLMLEAFKAEGSNEERQRKSISGQTKALEAGRWTFVPKPGYMKGRETGIPEIHPTRGPALRVVLISLSAQIKTPTQALVDLNNSEFMSDGHSLYKMDKFRKIVTDPFYAGILNMQKQVQAHNENGLHEPLISKDQHYSLIRVMNGKAKNQNGPRKNGNPKYPANNIVACDLCLDKSNGRVVGFDHTNGKSNKVYEKYRCRACGRYIARDELHSEIERQFKENPITSDGIKNLLEALEIVWKQRERDSVQEVYRLNHKIKTIQEVIQQQVEAATDPSNASIKSEILNALNRKKAEVEELEVRLHTIETENNNDKSNFLQFALSFVGNLGTEFFRMSYENRLRCKQLLFPAGFYLDENKKVYTPEISPLITLLSMKKDAEASVNSRMVRVKRL